MLNSNIQYTNKLLSGSDIAVITSVQDFIDLVPQNCVGLALNTNATQRQNLVNIGLLPNSNPSFLRVIHNASNYMTLEYLELTTGRLWKNEINNGVLRNWDFAVFNADLFKVFRGTVIATLSSPSQLTAPGFYKIEAMTADVNAGLSEGVSMTDYETGDFYGLLMCVSASAANGCSYGTLIVTSPRFKATLWVGQIWKGAFAYWSKK